MTERPRCSGVVRHRELGGEGDGFYLLRCWPSQFEGVLSGRKPFEVRLNDRNYREGDRIVLREWTPSEETYTGREVLAEVTYVLGRTVAEPDGTDPSGIEVQPVLRLGIEPSWVVLGIRVVGSVGCGDRPFPHGPGCDCDDCESGVICDRCGDPDCNCEDEDEGDDQGR